ncbi:MAG TPA: hypothetical protein VGP25_07190 [Gemmatimonadaceae bacterium]|jgi:hypothetical protein|nr:hypothetical protein [Gemmatimonadaceae bacterium]
MTITARVLSASLVLACAAQAPRTASVAPTGAPATPASAVADTNGSALVPPGFGTLRQDDIAIKLQLSDVLVKLTPLDESVIRTLSPDSYRALRELAESRRPAIARLAAQHGFLHGSVWYVSFYGLAPEARFSPLELTVGSAGRDYRPAEVIPLSSGFGSQRLQPRETQSALYLFDDALDVNQPLTVSLSGQTSSSWATTLRTVERERALIRSRMAQQPRSGTAP